MPMTNIEEAATGRIYARASYPLEVEVGEGVCLDGVVDPRMRTGTTQLRMLGER
jgi:hypothetical protein